MKLLSKSKVNGRSVFLGGNLDETDDSLDVNLGFKCNWEKLLEKLVEK